MPEYLTPLYMDCIVLRTMETNNKDQEDENYAPIIKEFHEAWNNFTRKAMPVKQDKRMVIW